MNHIEELKAVRQRVAELEQKITEEMQERAQLLGVSLGNTPAPKQKRTRRTKAQIQAGNARAEAAE